MIDSPEYILSSAKIGTCLIVMIIILWIISLFIKKSMKGNLSKIGNRQMRVIENCYIGVKKSISLVEVPGAYLIVGIAGDNITLLDKIEELENVKNSREEKVETGKTTPIFEKTVGKLFGRSYATNELSD